MAEQSATMPQVKRIEFRIGIHVGDIIVDDNDIFGDGVRDANATRLRNPFKASSDVDASHFDPFETWLASCL